MNSFGPVVSATAAGKGIVLSHLKMDNSNYLFVLNRDYQSKQTVRLTFNKPVAEIELKPTPPVIPDTFAENKTVEITLEPGDVTGYGW